MNDPRSRLLADRREVEGAVRAASAQIAALMSAQRDVAADDEHDPEGPTASLQLQESRAMLRQANQHLEEVDAALLRVEQGTYGVCESCGRDIPTARLEVRPYARRCVVCAAREERT